MLKRLRLQLEVVMHDVEGRSNSGVKLGFNSSSCTY